MDLLAINLTICKIVGYYPRLPSESEYVLNALRPCLRRLRKSRAVTQSFLAYAAVKLGTDQKKIHLRLRQAYIGRPPAAALALVMKAFFVSGQVGR